MSENFFNKPNTEFNINPMNKEGVDLTLDINNSKEGQLSEIQDNEIIREELTKEIEKYNETYLLLVNKKNFLYKEIENEEPSSKKFFLLNQDITDINQAISSINNLIDRKQKTINKLDNRSKYLIENN